MGVTTNELFALVSATLLIYLIYYWFTSTFDHWKKLGIPGPEPTIFLGNFGPLFLRQSSLAETLDALYKKWKHEPFFGIFKVRLPMLIVNDPEVLKNMFVKDFHVFPGRGMNFDEVSDPLAGNLFHLEGPRWASARNKLTPAFTTEKLKQMVDLMLECVSHFETHLLENVSKDKVIDCYGVAEKFTIDVIGSCAFGINMNALAREDSEFRIVGKKIFEPSWINFFRSMFREDLPVLANFLGLTTLSRDHTEFIVNSVKETMEYREKENVVRHDLIDMLIYLKKNREKLDFEVTEGFLASQALLFLVAGFQSSAGTIAFALYELATFPKTQEKLRAEIHEVLSKHNGQLTYNSIRDMKYLEMVIKETLRKNPPFIFLRRMTTEPYTIPRSNITIPKGTIINLPTYSIHHDDRYYPNPEVFDPERFNENQQRHPMVFIPFGEGPKKCIGIRFAMYQIQLGIITAIKNFQVSPSPSTEVPYEIDKSGIILTPVGGIKLTFERINQS